MKNNKEELNFNNKEIVFFLLFELFILFVNPIIELMLFSKLFDYLTDQELLQGLSNNTKITILSILTVVSAVLIIYVIYAFITRLIYFPQIDFNYSSKSLSPRFPEDRFKLEIYCSNIWGKAQIEINKSSEFFITGWREKSRTKIFFKRCLAFIVWPFWFISIKHIIRNGKRL